MLYITIQMCCIKVQVVVGQPTDVAYKITIDVYQQILWITKCCVL